MAWSKEPRWHSVERPYSWEDVAKLSGSIKISHTLAQEGATKLWNSLHRKKYVSALGALTGNQAMQQAKAGLDAIYLSGWQVAGDANDSLQMYPDQSLYSVSSVPTVVKRINNTFQRADQIQRMELGGFQDPRPEGWVDYFLPIVADAESGFGGVLNTHELVKALIEAPPRPGSRGHHRTPGGRSHALGPGRGAPPAAARNRGPGRFPGLVPAARRTTRGPRGGAPGRSPERLLGCGHPLP